MVVVVVRQYSYPGITIILEEIYLSAREVGAAINSPIRTIENWAAAGNIQQDSQGKYGLISAYRFKLQTVEKKLEKIQSVYAELKVSLNEDFSETRQRKAIAEADKEVALAKIKELELEKLQGKLVDSAEVQEAWENLVANCCAKFNGLPTKLALELSGMKPEEIQARLSEAIDEALVELSVTR